MKLITKTRKGINNIHDGDIVSGSYRNSTGAGHVDPLTFGTNGLGNHTVFCQSLIITRKDYHSVHVTVFYQV